MTYVYDTSHILVNHTIQPQLSGPSIDNGDHYFRTQRRRPFFFSRRLNVCPTSLLAASMLYMHSESLSCSLQALASPRGSASGEEAQTPIASHGPSSRVTGVGAVLEQSSFDKWRKSDRAKGQHRDDRKFVWVMGRSVSSLNLL